MTTKFTDNGRPPNCFVVNCARTEKMACFANSLMELTWKASNWFNTGPGALEKIVLERNGKLVKTEEEFVELPVDDTLMYVNFYEKWEEARPNIVEKLEAKLFYDRRPKKELPKGIPKRVVGFYLDLIKNDAFKEDKAWDNFKVLTLQAIMCADLEILKNLVKTGKYDTLKSIKDKAWELYCHRVSEMNRNDDVDYDLGWPADGEEDEFLTPADVASETRDFGILAAG